MTTIKNLLTYLTLNKKINLPSAIPVAFFSFFLFASIHFSVFKAIYILMDNNLIGFSYKRNNNISIIYNFNLFTVFVSILVPILEEVLYRLGLKFSRINVSFLFLGILWVPMSLIVKYLTTQTVFTFLFIFAILFVIIYISILKKEAKIKSIWSNYFFVIATVSILCFSVNHIGNYDIVDKNKALFGVLPLLSPYFISGYYLSIVRIRHGIYLSIILHIATNLVSNLLSLLGFF